jgi:hypothetical protein
MFFSENPQEAERLCIKLKRKNLGPVYKETRPKTEHMMPFCLQRMPKQAHDKHTPCPTTSQTMA